MVTSTNNIYSSKCTTTQIEQNVATRKRSSTHYPIAFCSVHTGIKPPFPRNFYQNTLCDHCLDDLGLYIRKMTNREIVNFQKLDFLRFISVNCVTTGARKFNETSQISLATHNSKREMREI